MFNLCFTEAHKLNLFEHFLHGDVSTNVLGHFQTLPRPKVQKTDKDLNQNWKFWKCLPWTDDWLHIVLVVRRNFKISEHWLGQIWMWLNVLWLEWLTGWLTLQTIKYIKHNNNYKQNKITGSACFCVNLWCPRTFFWGRKMNVANSLSILEYLSSIIFIIKILSWIHASLIQQSH